MAFNYNGAFSPAVRKSPIDNTDFELNDAYKPTGAITQPERSLSGGATASDPGAGANSVYGPTAPNETSSGLVQSHQPNIIRDVYAPHLQEVSQKLQDAYAAPRPGAARQIFGAILSRRNPALGGLISGETQRQQRIQPLQQEAGLIGGQIQATRAQENQEVENNLKTAQTKYANAHANVIENPPPKATPEEQDIQDLMKPGSINPATQKPYTFHEARDAAAQGIQDTKPAPIPKEETPDQQAMSALMKTINKRTGKPYTAYEARVQLAQAMQDTKPEKTPKDTSEHDMEPVMAYDKSGRAHIVPKSEAMAPGSGYTNPIKASDKDLNDAKTHAVVLNDMQSKLNDVHDAADALDQGEIQRQIISQALSHSEPGMMNDTVRRIALAGASEKTKDYIQKVLSLKESALGLPKEITGGSRTSEIQGNALFQTLPSGASANSDYARSQSELFQKNIDRLRNRVPAVRGMEEIESTVGKGKGKTTAGGGGLSRPKPNVVVEQ